MAIPFQEAVVQSAAVTSWRMNFVRNIERKNEGMAWISRNRNTDISTIGDVTGISQIEQGRGLDVVPFRERARAPRDRHHRRGVGHRAVGRRVLQAHPSAQCLTHGEHRLLGDRGRRPASQSDALQLVLPREARLLHAGRRYLPVRPLAAGRPAVLLAQARHRRGRPTRAARRRREGQRPHRPVRARTWPCGRKPTRTPT